MDAKQVKEVTNIIYESFTRLNRKDIEDFTRDELPSLVCEVKKEVCKKYPVNIRERYEFKNLLVNKTFELCKFFSDVKIEDVKMLYAIVGVTTEIRYENYDVDKRTNPKRTSQWVNCLQSVIYNQPADVIDALLENIEDTSYHSESYPKFYIKNGNNFTEVSKMMIKHLKATGETFTYGLQRKHNGHIYAIHLNCDEEGCPTCNLAICLQCGCAETDLTSDCIGSKLSEEMLIEKKIELGLPENEDNHKIDYSYKTWYKRYYDKNNNIDMALTWKDLIKRLNVSKIKISDTLDLYESLNLNKNITPENYATWEENEQDLDRTIEEYLPTIIENSFPRLTIEIYFGEMWNLEKEWKEELRLIMVKLKEDNSLINSRILTEIQKTLNTAIEKVYSRSRDYQENMKHRVEDRILARSKCVIK